MEIQINGSKEGYDLQGNRNPLYPLLTKEEQAQLLMLMDLLEERGVDCKGLSELIQLHSALQLHELCFIRTPAGPFRLDFSFFYTPPNP